MAKKIVGFWLVQETRQHSWLVIYASEDKRYSRSSSNTADIAKAIVFAVDNIPDAQTEDRDWWSERDAISTWPAYQKKPLVTHSEFSWSLPGTVADCAKTTKAPAVSEDEHSRMVMFFKGATNPGNCDCGAWCVKDARHSDWCKSSN